MKILIFIHAKSKKTILLYKDLFKEGSGLFLDFYFSLFFSFLRSLEDFKEVFSNEISLLKHFIHLLQLLRLLCLYI